MKIKYTLFVAAAASIMSTQAATLVGDITTAVAIDSTIEGSQLQMVGHTATIKSGGSVVFTNPSWESIIQQNSSATSTVTIETGGIMTWAGATGNGTRLFLGNAGGGTGIINLNGGDFLGANLTEFSLGRDGATGLFNISAGTAVVGNLTMGTGGSGGGTAIIDFSFGSTGELTVIGYDQTAYETLWTNGQLTRGNAQVGSFSDNFSVTGATLTAIPEPSSAALLGLGGLALVLRRRK